MELGQLRPPVIRHVMERYFDNSGTIFAKRLEVDKNDHVKR